MNIKKKLNKIQAIVDTLVTKYNTKNPFELAAKLKFQICMIDFNDDLLAFSSKDNKYDKGTIYINKNVGNYAAKILCAHEIGHLIMHRNSTNLFDKGIEPIKEFDANLFALCLVDTVSQTMPNNVFTSIETFNAYIDKYIKYISHSFKADS